ncbi:MAG: S-adenosylmethionine:tRNA ribosyltransferase-isomerase [Bacteroidota bacterium]|nr:S-adenosylmethionine:tRNA ribosyltransferase-isomerase [Bacteroidota bacterium]
MNPKNISISDYSYHLPEDKIAKFPLDQRDQSKLLLYKNGSISDKHFYDLPRILPEKSLLVFNNSKVIHARIVFQKISGTQIEIFCLEPVSGNYKQALGSTRTCNWNCMVGNAKRWKGEILQKEIFFHDKTFILNAELTAQSQENFTVRFSWDDETLHFAEVLSIAGLLPIPPYLNRDVTEADEINYQTIFAKKEGSVASPTAGLHFTDTVLEQLKMKKIKSTGLTLHVGAGTFKPVKSQILEHHEMHSETVFVSIETLVNIKKALEKKRKVIPVGTTSLRTLESIYWHGVKLLSKIQTEPILQLKQWEVYQLPGNYLAIDAFNAVIINLIENEKQELTGQTQILIAPGYDFKVSDILITNFHQPNSTLLLLIAAWAGNDWTQIYAHALGNSYRFLSFGDSSILFKT